MTALDNKFWKVNPQAKPKTLEHVSDQYAVVELKSTDPHGFDVWGCIDKDFSVGYIFAVKCRKTQAVGFCEDMQGI